MRQRLPRVPRVLLKKVNNSKIWSSRIRSPLSSRPTGRVFRTLIQTQATSSSTITIWTADKKWYGTRSIKHRKWSPRPIMTWNSTTKSKPFAVKLSKIIRTTTLSLLISISRLSSETSLNQMLSRQATLSQQQQAITDILVSQSSRSMRYT